MPRRWHASDGHWQWLPDFSAHIVKLTDEPFERTVPAVGFCDPMVPTTSQLVVATTVSVPRLSATEPRAPCAAARPSADDGGYGHRYVVDDPRRTVALDDLRALRMERVPHRPLLMRCWERRGNPTVYDAAYVALAELLSVTFLTADARPCPHAGTDLRDRTDSAVRADARSRRWLRVAHDGEPNTSGGPADFDESERMGKDGTPVTSTTWKGRR
jgi:hypothetical protein